MTTTTTSATFMQAAHLLAAHLTDHPLPQPASLQVITRAGHSQARAQVHSDTAPTVAADLLAWADTLTTITIQAWRPPHGANVHLSLTTTLTGPTGTIELDVYGGADDDSDLFADLAPDQHWDISLEHLRTWATHATDTPSGGAAT
jgi:hypothetical protein